MSSIVQRENSVPRQENSYDGAAEFSTFGVSESIPQSHEVLLALSSIGALLACSVCQHADARGKAGREAWA